MDTMHFAESENKQNGIKIVIHFHKLVLGTPLVYEENISHLFLFEISSIIILCVLYSTIGISSIFCTINDRDIGMYLKSSEFHYLVAE